MVVVFVEEEEEEEEDVFCGVPSPPNHPPTSFLRSLCAVTP